MFIIPDNDYVKNRIVRFESLSDYVDFVSQKNPYVEKGGHDWRSSRRQGTDGGFEGTATFNDAIDLARHGWAKGILLAKEFSAKITASLGHVEELDEWRRSVQGGGVIDVQAFNLGLPDVFNCLVSDEKEKFIKILYNARLSGDTSMSACVRRGAVVAAVVDALESNGYRCEIVSGFANSGTHGYTLETYVNLKAYNEPLDLDRVAFCFANAAFHRRLNWSFKELLPAKERKALRIGPATGGGYGAFHSFTDSADLKISENTNFNNENDAAVFIKNLLRDRFGIAFE